MSGKSTIEQLMKLDRGKVIEVETSKIRAKRLSRVAGEDVFVTVKALPGDEYAELSSRAVGKDNQIDASKSYDTQALIVSAGMVDPDLKDKDLQAYYETKTSKDLAKVLFPGGELSNIANEIGRLSGFVDMKDDDDEIKN